MKNKLANILKSITESELKLFSLYLNSPYFSRSKQLLELLNYLSKFHPDYDSKRIAKETIFKKLFPTEEFKKKRITNLMSKLSNELERFIAVQGLIQNERLQHQIRMNYYNENKSYLMFKNEINWLKNDIANNQLRDMPFYLQSLQLDEQLYFHPETKSFQKGQLGPKEIMEFLDLHYILGKIRFMCELEERKIILGEENDSLFSQEVLAYIDSNFIEKNELVDMYRMILRMQQNNEREVLFIKAKNYFLEIIKKISPQEQRTIFQYLINATIRNIRKGKEAYKQEQFELFKIGLTYEACLLHEEMTDVTFVNIVMLAASLKEFIWVNDFIPNYQKRTPISTQENMLSLSKAIILFHRDAFSDTLNFLNVVDFSQDTTMRYKLWQRSFQLRTYYELLLRNSSYVESFYSFAEAFKRFMQRNNEEISIDQGEAYLNYIGLTLKLTRIYEQSKFKLLDKLEVTILHTEQLIAKSWLLQKVKALKKA